MTPLVLLVLAAIWIAVLVSAVRDRAEARPGDSISSFRRQLAVLQRARPRPARAAGMRPQATRPGVQNLRLATVNGLPAARALAAPAARRNTQKRRRDVFFALLCTMGITLALGFVPALRMLWLAHLLVDVLFVAYVALLIRLRNLAAEREMKVRFLPGTAMPGPAALQPAFVLRRSAN